jgi:predicted amidohydrolase YtcJ
MRLDLVIDNAIIHTMDPARPRAQRIGVWRGQIAGLDDDLDAFSAEQVVDAAGATLLPGFVDAHTHLAWQGVGMGAVDIAPAQSVEQALRIIEDAAGRPGSGWVDVAGYDQRVLGRHLTAGDLDPVSHGRRLYVTHVSGHACVVNSAVLADLPAQALAIELPGVIRGRDGRPAGVFTETAQSLVRELRLPYSLDELEDAIARSTALCASQGVTFCGEAGLGAGLVRHSPVELAAYQRLAERGALPVRVQAMVTGDFLHPLGAAETDPGRGIDLGMRTGFGSDRLSLGPVKLWLDGGMSTRTAALSEPYGAGGMGQLADDIGEYERIVVDAHAAGWQLALHAIGDRAVDVALDLITEALRRYPRADCRPRIEHCGLVRPDQLPRLASAGVIPVVQPAFLYEFGDDYAAIMGAERAPWMYRGRSFLDHGLRLAASSDRPVTAGAPLTAIAFMATRRSQSGQPIGAAEALTVHEALRAYTIDAAYACRVEHLVGSLRTGKRADLVVLDRDPLDTPPDRLPDIAVKATLLDGRPVHTDGSILAG